MDEVDAPESLDVVDAIELSLNDSDVNMSSLCAARSLQRNYLLPLPPAELVIVRSFQFVYFFALLSVGGVLNSAIAWSVVRHKKLRTLDIAISLQVVVISLATIIVVILPALVNIAAGEWVFGALGCSIFGFMEYILRSTRRNLMVALVLNRFFLVFYPFTYQKYHKKAVIIFSAISWVGTVLFRVTGLPGILDCYTITSTGVFCSFVGRCSEKCIIAGYLDFGIFHLPFYLIPVILYSIMYKKGRKMAKSSSGHGAMKANVTFFLLFVTSVVCNIPTIGSILILQIVLAVQGFSLNLAITLFVLAHTILLLVVMDAVVILRHRDIKNTLWSSVLDAWKTCAPVNIVSRCCNVEKD